MLFYHLSQGLQSPEPGCSHNRHVSVAHQLTMLQITVHLEDLGLLGVLEVNRSAHRVS